MGNEEQLRFETVWLMQADCEFTQVCAIADFAFKRKQSGGRVYTRPQLVVGGRVNVAYF